MFRRRKYRHPLPLLSLKVSHIITLRVLDCLYYELRVVIRYIFQMIDELGAILDFLMVLSRVIKNLTFLSLDGGLVQSDDPISLQLWVGHLQWEDDWRINGDRHMHLCWYLRSLVSPLLCVIPYQLLLLSILRFDCIR